MAEQTYLLGTNHASMSFSEGAFPPTQRKQVCYRITDQHLRISVVELSWWDRDNPHLDLIVWAIFHIFRAIALACTSPSDVTVFNR
jgi:hypothetical protein